MEIGVNKKNKITQILTTILIIVVSLFSSCNKGKNSLHNQQKIIDMNDSINNTEEYLDETYKYKDHDLTESEIIKGIPIIEKGLINNNFQPLSDIKYAQKLKEVFGITLSKKECYKIIEYDSFYVYTVPENGSEDEMSITEKIEDNKAMAFEYADNIYFIKRKNFISKAYYLVDLVKDMDGENIPNLPTELIHRNKYVFYNNKASLTWLKNNDSRFLEILVEIFGYMQDKDLLKWLLDKRCNLKSNDEELRINLDNFRDLLVRHDCNGVLHFNQEVLDVAEENLSEKYVDQISLFLVLSLDNQYSDFIFTNFSFEEWAEVCARLLYWGESVIEKNRSKTMPGEEYRTYSAYSGRFMVYFLVNDKEVEKYEKEFEQNNYYGLPKFKEYWENAKRTKIEEYETGPVRHSPEDEG